MNAGGHSQPHAVAVYMRFSVKGVQHHWHTARNEAIANGGKESGTLDSVPARTAKRLESNQRQPPAAARLASIQFSMTVMSLGASGLQSAHVRA